MSILNTLHRVGALLRASLSYKPDPARSIALSFTRLSDGTEEKAEINDEDSEINEDSQKNAPRKAKVPIIPLKTSIEYMESDAYKQTYGNNPVWKLYRRNHKGMYAPRKTRRTCIRYGAISAGNPCPLCRDEYLVLHHRNVKLLEQFINKYNGEILSYSKTGICQKKHKQLLVAITKAKDYGIITFDVPRRQYDYSDWMPANN